jgi:hypothetical protein
VTYASSAPNRQGSTNLVKPVYHVAWLASRLELEVVEPLAPATGTGGRPLPATRGMTATLAWDGREVGVVVRPVASSMPPGTTLRVELLAERRGSELRADVTAEAELVHVRVWEDGVESLDRAFRAPRRTEADLLMEAIEATGDDRVTAGAIRVAGHLLATGGRAREGGRHAPSEADGAARTDDTSETDGASGSEGALVDERREKDGAQA